MSLIFYAVKSRTGERLARLPLTPEGEFGTTISTFSSATFSLDINDKECPDDWADHIEPMLMSILVCDEANRPLWLGLINNTPVTSGGGVKIPCASMEWGLDKRYPQDHTFGTSSDFMAIPRALISDVEAGGVGFGLLTDAPDCGTPRAYTVKNSDRKSVAAIFDELGLEWTITLSWKDSSQDVILKTFTAREPNLGNNTATPEFVINYPGNADTWSFDAPATDGKAATCVQALGDGTGDLRTTSLPVIDTDKEAAGYPRIEHFQTFTGVTNVNDANALAQQISQDLFNRRHVIAVTVLNAGATSFADTTLGSSVRINIDSPELRLDEVWRFVGWTMSADGLTWTPTLAKLGTKVKDFPRANDPSALGRALRELAKPTLTDPLVNGYTFPANSDGVSFAIDPSKGFGSYDASGAFTPFSGGTGTIPWNPGSGSGTNSGANWGFGSEGSDPGATPVYADQFDMSEPYIVNNPSSSNISKPATQNEGNIVFAHSGNDKAFTSMSYTGMAFPPGDNYGYLDVNTGYLQHGQLAEWTLRASAPLTAQIMGDLLQGSSAAVRPSPIISNGQIVDFMVTGTRVDFTGQPFSVGGYFYIPVSTQITWSAGGTNNVKQCLRFLRMQVMDYKTLGPLEAVKNADIPSAYSGSQLRSMRAGSQVLLATLYGNGGSILYSGLFDGATGDISNDGFAVIPPINAGPDTSGYVAATSSSDTAGTTATGMSLYTAAGQLELGDGLAPRDASSSWHGAKLPGYAIPTAAFGRPVLITAVIDPATNRQVVQAGMLDASGVSKIGGGTYTDDGYYSPSSAFSYGGYIYGFSSSYDYSAKLTPKPATP